MEETEIKMSGDQRRGWKSNKQSILKVSDSEKGQEFELYPGVVGCKENV